MNNEYQDDNAVGRTSRTKHCLDEEPAGAGLRAGRSPIAVLATYLDIENFNCVPDRELD
jgi:hypothetical protein